MAKAFLELIDNNIAANVLLPFLSKINPVKGKDWLTINLFLSQQRKNRYLRAKNHIESTVLGNENSSTIIKDLIRHYELLIASIRLRNDIDYATAVKAVKETLHLPHLKELEVFYDSNIETLQEYLQSILVAQQRLQGNSGRLLKKLDNLTNNVNLYQDQLAQKLGCIRAQLIMPTIKIPKGYVVCTSIESIPCFFAVLALAVNALLATTTYSSDSLQKLGEDLFNTNQADLTDLSITGKDCTWHNPVIASFLVGRALNVSIIHLYEISSTNPSLFHKKSVSQSGISDELVDEISHEDGITIIILHEKNTQFLAMLPTKHLSHNQSDVFNHRKEGEKIINFRETIRKKAARASVYCESSLFQQTPNSIKDTLILSNHSKKMLVFTDAPLTARTENQYHYSLAVMENNLKRLAVRRNSINTMPYMWWTPPVNIACCYRTDLKSTLEKNIRHHPQKSLIIVAVLNHFHWSLLGISINTGISNRTEILWKDHYCEDPLEEEEINFIQLIVNTTYSLGKLPLIKINAKESKINLHQTGPVVLEEIKNCVDMWHSLPENSPFSFDAVNFTGNANALSSNEFIKIRESHTTYSLDSDSLKQTVALNDAINALITTYARQLLDAIFRLPLYQAQLFVDHLLCLLWMGESYDNQQTFKRAYQCAMGDTPHMDVLSTRQVAANYIFYSIENEFNLKLAAVDKDRKCQFRAIARQLALVDPDRYYQFAPLANYPFFRNSKFQQGKVQAALRSEAIAFIRENPSLIFKNDHYPKDLNAYLNNLMMEETAGDEHTLLALSHVLNLSIVVLNKLPELTMAIYSPASARPIAHKTFLTLAQYSGSPSIEAIITVPNNAFVEKIKQQVACNLQNAAEGRPKSRNSGRF